MCCDHALEILNTGGGSWSDYDSDDYRESFKEAYTIAVESKRRWNSIKKDWHFTSNSEHKVPVCVKLGSMKKFVKDMKAEKKSETTYHNWEDLDMKEGEEIGGGRLFETSDV